MSAVFYLPPRYDTYIRRGTTITTTTRSGGKSESGKVNVEEQSSVNPFPLIVVARRRGLVVRKLFTRWTDLSREDLCKNQENNA